MFPICSIKISSPIFNSVTHIVETNFWNLQMMEICVNKGWINGGLDDNVDMEYKVNSGLDIKCAFYWLWFSLQIFESCPGLTALMYEHGLLEVLCNTILAINKCHIGWVESNTRHQLSLTFSRFVLNEFPQSILHWSGCLILRTIIRQFDWYFPLQQ